MKIDAYHSQSHLSRGLVVPAGTDLEDTDGELSDFVEKMKPFKLVKNNIDVERLANRGLLDNVVEQLDRKGFASIQQVSLPPD